MDGIQAQRGSPPGEKHRWLLIFSLGGDLRFISHHDTLRLFRRALARADVPVRFSEGFNPHPKVMIPLPRPVGIASRDEALVLETTRLIEPEQALLRLREKTPKDIQLISLRRLEGGEQIEPVKVRYRLDLRDMDVANLSERVSRLQSAPTLTVERIGPKTSGSRTMDIRPYLLELRTDGSSVEFTLSVTGSGTARPAEVAGLLGYDPVSINHRIERLEVQWSVQHQRM